MPCAFLAVQLIVRGGVAHRWSRTDCAESVRDLRFGAAASSRDREVKSGEIADCDFPEKSFHIPFSKALAERAETAISCSRNASFASKGMQTIRGGPVTRPSTDHRFSAYRLQVLKWLRRRRLTPARRPAAATVSHAHRPRRGRSSACWNGLRRRCRSKARRSCAPHGRGHRPAAFNEDILTRAGHAPG